MILILHVGSHPETRNKFIGWTSHIWRSFWLTWDFDAPVCQSCDWPFRDLTEPIVIKKWDMTRRPMTHNSRGSRCASFSWQLHNHCHHQYHHQYNHQTTIISLNIIIIVIVIVIIIAIIIVIVHHHHHHHHHPHLISCVWIPDYQFTILWCTH